MKQQISSENTAYWKYIFPGVWITLMGIGVCVTAFHISEPGAAIFPIMWLVASGYLIWFARRLKFVSIDEKVLYVSGFREEIQIPFSNVRAVKENFWAKPKVITVTLNQPSKFGNVIVFVPTTLFFGAFRSHPVVDQIRKLIDSNRSYQIPNQS